MATQAKATYVGDDEVLRPDVKPLVVSKWLKGLTDKDDVITRQKLAQVLKQAAQSLNVDVITLFQPPTLSKQTLCNIINTTDHHGMTIVHHAAQGHKLQKNKACDYDLLEVLAHLCDQGGDPTLVCKQGKSAKEIVKKRKIKIVIVLLEILESIRCQKLRRHPTSEYADINALHKTLLHWAVHTGRHLIVSQILIMHSRDENISHMMFEVDANSPDRFQEAPIFTAARISNPQLFEILVSNSSIAPNNLLGHKREHSFNLIDGSTKKLWDTPLSLILSAQNYPLIDVLVNLSSLFCDRCLTKVDLSYAKMQSLPVELFKLSSLHHLNLSNNNLSELSLPSKCWPNILQLKEFIISHNVLEHIPSELFSIRLETLNVSHNPLKSLPKEWWNTKSIVEFDVSFTHLESLSTEVDPFTSQIITPNRGSSHGIHVPGRVSNFQFQHSTAIPTECTTASVLQSLNASHCNIKVFPDFLALFLPKLEVLNLSHNNLQFCCAINRLPTILRKLDLSNNLLKSSNEQAVFYYCEDLSKKSGCMDHKELCRLKILTLANNANLKCLKISDESEMNNDHVFFPKLLKLDVSNCGLQCLPCNLVQLQSLISLNISNNKDLAIPKEVCSLKKLADFNYDGIRDPIINELNRFTSTLEKRLYLCETHFGWNTLQNPSVKLIFLGHEEVEVDLVSSLSKTALMSRDKSIELVVADENTWIVSHSEIPNYSISFNVWNFINQNEFTSVNQCFFTDNALYVLCWHITDDQDHGIGKLRKWLLSIQEQVTTKASALIIGCRSTSIGNNLSHSIKSKIQHLFGDKSDSSAIYPVIIDIKFVSIPKLERDIPGLWSCLFDVSSNLITSGRSKVIQRVKDTKVPVKYIKLQYLLTGKMSHIRKHKEDGPPIMTWKEMVLMVGLNNPNDAHCLFTNENDFSVAVKYLQSVGLIMHFDYPDLNDYYFIDPHWLYDVFRRVCTSSMLTSSRIEDDNDAKVHQSQIQQIFDDCGIPMGYSKQMFKLLYRFEVAIPLDSKTLLLPSILKNNTQYRSYSSSNCNFPRKPINISNTRLHHSFRDILPPVAITPQSTDKIINLFSTGMCYRRHFLAHHIPERFWHKLIPRFITSAKLFYNILVSNCIDGVNVESTAIAGEAFICNNHCKWLYWRNGITLTFGDDVLLCVNGILQHDDVAENSSSSESLLSVIRDKIRTIKFFDGNQWKPPSGEDGIEVKVPDYKVESSSTKDDTPNRSSKLGSQILSQVLEILNELSVDFVKGDFVKGIYSGSYFNQVVICPFCYGDTSVAQSMEMIVTKSGTSNLFDMYENSVEYTDVKEYTISSEISLHGFSIQFCILKAQKPGKHGLSINCPKHGVLKLKYLTPDLMFEDITLNKVNATEVDQPLASGSFGTVYKVKHPSDPKQYVALKCFTKEFINGSLRKQTSQLQSLTRMYSDIRMELNKLSSIDHPHIIEFLGLCVISFSFLLEWAPKGSLREIIQAYKLAEFAVCPDTVTITVLQVSSALAYLHSEKNIIHFDIKPGNVLVFKYPQPGHHCFSSEASLTYESCHDGGGDVLVKLADLGISALFGQVGFQHSRTTMGYAAPEILKYLGSKPVSEKVDIFSLGGLLYTIMTLRKLPPEGHYAEYNENIVAGKRPEFLLEDPNYPLLLIECMESCWAQEYTQRPAAKKMEDTLKATNFVALKNSYEIKDTMVSAALVTKTNSEKEEIIWIATTSEVANNLVSYTFSPQKCLIARANNKHDRPKLYMNNSVKLNGRVKEMCHHGQHIWILYTSGYIAVFDMDSHEIIQNIQPQEPNNDPVTIVVVDHATGLIATAYTNGLIAYLWDKSNLTDDNISTAYFYSSSKVSYQKFKLTTVESCSDVDGHCQIWCGYNIGVILIVTPLINPWEETKTLKTLQMLDYTELPLNTNVTQLKYSPKQQIMYALHDDGWVISCWNVGTNPEFCTVIKPPLNAPASVLLPVGHTIFIGDTSGKVLTIDTRQIEEGKYSFQLLPGGHCVGNKVDYLLAQQGVLNPQGFLSMAGDRASYKQSVSHFTSLDYVPCTVLISIGIGYQGTFIQCAEANDSTYFVTWAFPLL